MKKLLSLIFLTFFMLPAGNVWAQSQCFKLYQPGTNQEITVICAGVPFEIRNCSAGFGSQDYYCLDSAAARRSEVNCFIENKPGTTFRYNTPGKYIITQLFIINGNRFPFEKRYTVKDTPPPVFTATTCGQNQTEITVTDTNYDAYQIAVNSNVPVAINPNTPTIIPTPTGSFTITVTARYNISGWCGSKSVTLTSPEAPANPVIQNLNVQGEFNSGKILFTLSNLKGGYNYIIEEQQGAVFQPKGNLVFRSSQDTVTIKNLDTATPRNYRVSVQDMCGRQLNFKSAVVGSTRLTAVSQDGKVFLTWPSYLNSTGRNIYYEIKRTSGTAGTEVIFPDKLTGTGFIDSTAVCGTTYCYELLVAENNKVFSQSNDPCVLVTSTLIPKGGFLLTGFTPENVLTGTLTLPARATLKELNVFRSPGNASFKPITKTATPQFTDSQTDFLKENSCYKTTFTDNCGNTSEESNVSCPVILRADYTPALRTLKLSWNEYTGFTGAPVSYFLEILNGANTVIEKRPVTGLVTLTETQFSQTNQVLRYRIRVTSGKPGEETYSNTFTLEQEANVFIPSAFSPNGDGLNDFFEVKGRFQNNFSFVILNRWGQLLFESNDPKKGWDGKSDGTTVPVGVYVYKVKATDEMSRKFEKTGTVTVVK